jgi:hypothetical protein
LEAKHEEDGGVWHSTRFPEKIKLTTAGVPGWKNPKGPNPRSVMTGAEDDGR